MKVSLVKRVLLGITMMFSSASALTDLSLTEANKLVDRTFSSSQESGLFKLNIDSSIAAQTYLFIFVSGEGMIQVFGSSNDQPEESLLCSGQTNITCAFLLSDMEKRINSPEGFRFSAKSASAPNNPIRIGAYVGDHLILHENHRQTVILKEITDLPVSVNIIPSNSTSKIRIQLKAHPEKKFAALNAYLNIRKPEFPSPESHEQEFIHLDSIRSAFTSYNSEDTFCKPENISCIYRLLIQTEGIASIQVGVLHSAKREDVLMGYRYVAFLPHLVRPI